MEGLFSAGVDFLKKKISKPELSKPDLPTVSSNQVLYTYRELSDVIGSEPMIDELNVVSLSKMSLQCLKDSLPFANIFCRFLIESDNGKIWIDETSVSDTLPTYKETCIAQIIHFPVSLRPNQPDSASYSGQCSADDRRTPSQSIGSSFPHKPDMLTKEEKVAAAMDKFAAKNAFDDMQKQMKVEAQNSLSESYDRWALTDAGKLRDVRTLLSTLPQVMWPDSGWVPIPISELMLSDATVKKAWRKAIIICHPDRHQNASPEQQYRADRIFASINEAFKNFS